MTKMNIRMCGGDCLPSGMTSRALSGKPAPDKVAKISREELSGLAQRLVTRAGNLAKGEKGGKLSPESEKVAIELGELLGNHGKELTEIGLVKNGEMADAYSAVLMSRSELLSYKDGGSTGGF